MNHATVRIGSRSSPLARLQCEEVLPALQSALPPGTGFEFVHMDTIGDRDQDSHLGTSGVPDDFFTRDLDDALRDGGVDLVIHSAKDLPVSPVNGIVTAALLPSRDIRDALVLPRGRTAESPPLVIGTSSPRREQEILRLFPGAATRPLRGTIEQRIDKLDRGEYDAVIVAACALERLGLGDRISAYLPYDPAPQQGRLAITARADDTQLLRCLRAIDVRRTAGLVAIVGCPVDETLLSSRAEMYLRQCDIVFHDRLVPDGILLAMHGKAVAVGKSGGQPSLSQAEIHRMLLEQVERGRLVVRLHGGDPGIYGHLAEELEFLSAWNIRTDIVPAVSAVQVAAARAGAPLTHRGQGRRVTLVSGHANGGAEEFPPPSAGNLAVYMGARDVQTAAEALRRAGWPADACMVVGQRLGYRDETVVRTDLAHVDGLRIEPPAVLLLGPKTWPLPDATLFLGTDPEHFLAYGPLIHWPLIRLASLPLEQRVRHLAEDLDRVRGVIFPSRFAVRALAEALMSWKDVRALAGKVLLAVGPSTEAELAEVGLRADGTAEGFEGVRSLVDKVLPEWRGEYLYPCSDAAPVEDRKNLLREKGIALLPRVFYANRRVPMGALPRRPFSRVLFTSSSTVKAYFELYPEERTASRTWIAVGPSTLHALQELGLEADTI